MPNLDFKIQVIFDELKKISAHISQLLKDSGSEYLESSNSSGDAQLAVDVLADTYIEKQLLALECIAGVCSEEKAEIIGKNGILDSKSLLMASPLGGEGKLYIAYDPLDGSSLMDSNLAVGSIFGIYENSFSAQNLIAASYVVYGPRIEIIFATKNALFYQKQTSKQEYINLTPPKLGQKGKLNAPGGTQKHWSKTHKDFIDSLFANGYRLRYSGGMVPDLHQILIKGGGLFSYPATQDAPNGKLRKLFEVFPMSFIYEQAGGEAIDGARRILDLACDSLHQSTPCFLGSKEEINALKQAYKEER